MFVKMVWGHLVELESPGLHHSAVCRHYTPLLSVKQEWEFPNETQTCLWKTKTICNKPELDNDLILSLLLLLLPRDLRHWKYEVCRRCFQSNVVSSMLLLVMHIYDMIWTTTTYGDRVWFVLATCLCSEMYIRGETGRLLKNCCGMHPTSMQR